MVGRHEWSHRRHMRKMPTWVIEFLLAYDGPPKPAKVFVSMLIGESVARGRVVRGIDSLQPTSIVSVLKTLGYTKVEETKARVVWAPPS